MSKYNKSRKQNQFNINDCYGHPMSTGVLSGYMRNCLCDDRIIFNRFDGAASADRNRHTGIRYTALS